MTLGEEAVTTHFFKSNKKNQNVANHLILTSTVKLAETEKAAKSAAWG